jgi:hypothetical protein
MSLSVFRVLSVSWVEVAASQEDRADEPSLSSNATYDIDIEYNDFRRSLHLLH